MNYKHDFDKLMKKHGRTRNWIASTMGVSRTTFWHKVNHDLFTATEKKTIERIIIKGK